MGKKSGNIGILVGGGPAPGINGVIAAAVIEARKENMKIIGILDGYKYLVQGDLELLKAHAKEISIKDVSRIHFDGGSVLRTSRTNPAKVKNGVENAVKMLEALDIRYMVTIGGDDTAFGASKIAEEAKRQNREIKFAHVPKTIDNDLPLPRHVPTFGFETARHVGTDMVKNLMHDSKTTSRWYIIVAMGRHSGHLALGMAKSAGATLFIIPEQFDKTKPITLKRVCDVFEAAIIKRRAMGHDHGVLVIAEGVAERFTAEELKSIPGLVTEYDAFGHLALAEVELGKVLKLEIQRRFEERGEKFRMVEINIGYALRCADPIPFDQDYTRDLGYSAVRYLLSSNKAHQDNAMISVVDGKLAPIKFEDIIDPNTGKTAIRMVDVSSYSYRVAREFTIHLQKRDFNDPDFLAKLAKIAKMTPEEFVQRFHDVAEEGYED